MESFISFSTLFNLVLTVIWFISGIRDLQGKDPFLDLPFNQYHRDPEYRAFWQKKAMCGSMMPEKLSQAIRYWYRMRRRGRKSQFCTENC